MKKNFFPITLFFSLILFVVFVSFFLININKTNADSPTSGLIGYWSFNEGSGSSVADTSLSGLNGSIINTPSWLTGKVGSSLGFNGTSTYVRILNNPILELASSSYTITTWVRNNGSLSATYGLISKSSGNTGYILGLNNSKILFRHLYGSGSYTMFSNSSININTWNHVALVYNRNTLKMYINGILDKEISASVDLGYNNSDLNFGRFSSNYLAGSMDEVRMYSRALSQEEIIQIFNDSSQSDPSPDNENPTTPINPLFNSVGSGNINISWGASSDNINVLGYLVYRNGIGIATTTSNSYFDLGLIPSTLYSYKVKAVDNSFNYSLDSVEISTTTLPLLDISSPIIYSIVSSSTLNSATVSWNTNELSNSQVEYGLTSSLGSFSGLDSSFVTSHSIQINSLIPNRTYYYRVRSLDQFGNLGTSSINTFNTLSGSGDITPPSSITNFFASNIKDNSFYLTWSAPRDLPSGLPVTSYDIRYSLSPISDSNWSDAIQLAGEPNPNPYQLPQFYKMTNLLPGTLYYVAIKSLDSNGNYSSISTTSATTRVVGASWGVPLTDMGTSTYLGFDGGLYGGGSNIVPEDHRDIGLNFGSAVEPLNSSGISDPNGKIVLISIGMSNTATEFCNYTSSFNCVEGSFMDIASKNSLVNHSNLVILNGAHSGQTADTWASSSSPNYNRVRDNVLIPSGVTENQVQVAWVKLAHIAPIASLPSDLADFYLLELNIGKVLRAMKSRYPNLKQVFLTSRVYGGYSSGDLNSEPFPYESSFAFRSVIKAQIDQMRNYGNVVNSKVGNLNYNSGNSAWVAWGPYLWADGLNPRSDGLTYSQSDFVSDGVHPSNLGVKKLSESLLNFFLNSEFTPWFRASSSN